MKTPYPVWALACLALSTQLEGVSGQARDRERPSPATLACGSEIAWQPSIDVALERAREVKRPVFWYVPTVAGSRMDRKPVIDLYMMCGPFASATVATLLDRHFVPVKAAARGDLQKKYALRPLSFIEPGFLVLAPDGAEIKRVDKISTFSEEWFVWQLRESLRRRPDLARDSDVVAKARRSENSETLAAALVSEGAVAEALAALGPPEPDEEPHCQLLRARALIASREPVAALTLLQALGRQDGPLSGGIMLVRGHLELKRGRFGDALAHFESSAPNLEDPSVRAEAQFFTGVCHHARGDRKASAVAWAEAVATAPDSRHGRKAAAELQRLGPFSRSFERFEWLPEDAFVANPDGTRVARRESDIPMLARRSVELLLLSQSSSGVWDDSNYDFAGTVSLPNVYVAGTALSALALLEWRAFDAPAIDAAVDRALEYLLDESHIASGDRKEIVWAHAYRLLLFERLLGESHSKERAIRGKVKEIVAALLSSQLRNGGWAHEYPNPFATATVMHALAKIDSVGFPIGREAMLKGVRSLDSARGKDGTFGYNFGRPGSRPEFSAGRSPLCELALFLGGASDQERLRGAIELSFSNHHYLERVRKYDDHADEFQNGGFFFWYALHGRMEAVNALAETNGREEMRRRLLQAILELPEIDGGFVDSHELGKSYGTAMALLCLKGTLPPKE